MKTGYRSHTCGELNASNIGDEVKLCGWVQKSRDLGGMTFIDLRDRYGITQLVFNMEKDENLCLLARDMHREYIVFAKGIVRERENKNKNIPTGEIEIEVLDFSAQKSAENPPFTIEEDSDGGEELRMKYRYLDLRRPPLQRNLKLRNDTARAVRNYLGDQNFMEIETPYLIKSTPEGARDFVVPSRMHVGQFYALPQSPQTFKQLLMVSGFDRYFQIVKCFRDEDLRADRQPEFTQIDCEMSFVNREDVLSTFEGMTRDIFKKVRNIELPEFEIMSYETAMSKYGSDKPDTRFGMEFVELNDVAQNKGFKVFDDSELVVGICVKGAAEYSRKQLDALTDFVRRPQVGGKGVVYVKCNDDGSYKSSVDKFFDQNDLAVWADKMDAQKGDLILIISGAEGKSRQILCDLRLEMAGQLDLIDKNVFKPLWVVDFPLFEKDEETGALHSMHHPFTSFADSEMEKFSEGKYEEIVANAYDLVINGVEIGGGSIRITDNNIQKKVLNILGFSEEEANAQFGFLMNSFKHGAPPHGGIAFGFDRLCALLGGSDSIRDFIAFPKNNAGRDVMIDAPSPLDQAQLDELGIEGIKQE